MARPESMQLIAVQAMVRQRPYALAEVAVVQQKIPAAGAEVLRSGYQPGKLRID